MKFAAIVFAILTIAVLSFGTPLPVAIPEVGTHWNSPEPILPMTFGHVDHTNFSCIECHHNYIDDTGGGPCMYCHVNDERVSHLLRKQYHDLCMGCHVTEQRAGEVHGPTRQCIACHVSEEVP